MIFIAAVVRGGVMFLPGRRAVVCMCYGGCGLSALGNGADMVECASAVAFIQPACWLCGRHHLSAVGPAGRPRVPGTSPTDRNDALACDAPRRACCGLLGELARESTCINAYLGLVDDTFDIEPVGIATSRDSASVRITLRHRHAKLARSFILVVATCVNYKTAQGQIRR